MLAGGLDSFDWLKDRIKRPKVRCRSEPDQGTGGVRDMDGGIEIGAMTTLTEVVRDPIVKAKFSILSEGREAAASPQIRNQGTIGGNVSQDARCWYYRGGLKCYRAGGNMLLRRYADGHQPRARHPRRGPLRGREPSDSAPAHDGARREDGDSQLEGRARGGCRELFHRPGVSTSPA